MSKSITHSNDKETVFFIDKQQFKTEHSELSAGVILSQFAEEDPGETTLVLKKGNELIKYEDDSQIIELQNGMKFVVFHDGPTTVSAYGPNQLIFELEQLGYEVTLVNDPNNQPYVVIKDYLIELGKFAGRIIDLGIPATPNYPQSVGSSIHIKAQPQLYEKHDSKPNVRNIINSSLGSEWRYWSKNFNWNQQKQSARRLMAQIAGVFKNA